MSREATDPSARGLTWQKLLRIAVVGVVVGGIATEVLLIQGFEPVISAFQVVYIVGLFLLSSRPRAAIIVIGLATLGLIGFGAPFFVISLFHPKSTVEFAVNLVMLVSGIVSAIAVAALLRKATTDGPSAAARAVGLVSVAVIVVGLAFTIFVRLTLDEAEIRSGDLAMAAEDVHFSLDQLHANSGEVSIVIDNKDFSSHTFTIDKLDLDEQLPGGVATRVTFDVPSGTYRFYCSIPGHETQMHGTLTVH